MGTLLNWIDTMFFGIRRLFDGSDAELPERPAVKFAGACSLVDDPTNNRTVITVGGLIQDPDGGYTAGKPDGGWVTVKSDFYGFRVANSDETGYTLTVDNGISSVIVNGSLQLGGAQGMLLIGDTSPLSSLGSSAVAIQSAAGALKVTQYATPTVTGSRGGNAALASLLAVLANAGLIINNTTP